MTFTLLKPLRHAITQLPLGWLVVMPLVPSALGAMVLTGYLAQGPIHLEPGIVVLLFLPPAAGAGLAWLMAHSLGDRLQRLAHTNQDWAMAERTRLETERKQAETTLQQSESLNQTILKAIPDLIVRMDRQGNYLEIKLTDAFPLAINAQDVGKNILDILPEAVAQERLTAVQNALETQVMCRYESPFWVEGQRLWQEVRIVPIDSDQAVVIIRDMTQRHQTEAALRQSESRFRALAETVKEGFFVFETESSEYSYINPALTKLTGTPLSPSADEPLYARGMSHWLKNIHPEDLDRVEARLQDERQGENFDEEYRFIHSDGHQLWLRSKAFPLQDEMGNTVRIVGTVEDITDRKYLEQSLKEAEALFRHAFNDVPIGMTLVSATGQFIKANPYFCRLVGYTEAELTIRTFQSITHPDDLDEDLAGFEKLLTRQVPSSQLQKRYFDKQGNIVPVVINAAPVFDDRGQFLYCVGYIQDIRDRLAVERLKDEFLSMVSHELRTPITSIQGALTLLSAGVYDNRPEKTRQMLEIATQNSDRMVRLVNDILSFERLESGKVQLLKEPCQVADLMHQAIDTVQTTADRAAITLVVKPLTASLWAAPDAIIQTLTNLLNNAIKFSLPGDTIWLQAEVVEASALPAKGMTRQKPSPLPSPPALLLPSSPPTPYILFTVTDQGRGIPASKLDLIFDQFQQVDVSDSRQKGGTGLGLAICKKNVQQHGGYIWVESRLGEGSCFYVALPNDLNDPSESYD